jgi:UDP-glucose 4-epimerase
VLDPQELGRILDARPLRIPAAALRIGAWASWKLHLQPTPPGWVDMALAVPLLDTTRAREQLGWTPRYGADEALLELIEGMRQAAEEPTPPLENPGRVRELLTGVGRRT